MIALKTNLLFNISRTFELKIKVKKSIEKVVVTSRHLFYRLTTRKTC